ncbi:MAG: redox-sensing transcriptional repressor Rex [Treponemataceae bacterium]
MEKKAISRASIGRLPTYLNYLKALPSDVNSISATTIAKNLNFGEVQVRKDLASLCGSGRPKIGYSRDKLTESLESFLCSKNGTAVVVGAGKLGRALLGYGDFDRYGISMLAAFDKDEKVSNTVVSGKPVLPIEELSSYCKEHDVKIGIITVPSEAAQEVFEMLYDCGIRAVWCFSPCQLNKPEDAIIQYENMALSLAHLKSKIN